MECHKIRMAKWREGMTLPYWTIDGQFFILDGWAYGLTFDLKTVRMKEDKALRMIKEDGSST